MKIRKKLLVKDLIKKFRENKQWLIFKKWYKIHIKDSYSSKLNDLKTKKQIESNKKPNKINGLSKAHLNQSQIIK